MTNDVCNDKTYKALLVTVIAESNSVPELQRLASEKIRLGEIPKNTGVNYSCQN